MSHAGGVNCATYDFAAIYDQADKAAEARAREMTCPTMDCPNLTAYRVWHSWNCAGGNADAVLVWLAVCPRTEAPATLPPEQRKARPTELRATNVNTTTQPTTKENIDTTGGATKLACTPAEIVGFHYEVAEAARPADLKPYVDDAKNYARAFNATIQCAAGCTKQRFKVESVTWKWQAGMVYVDVYFIPCK